MQKQSNYSYRHLVFALFGTAHSFLYQFIKFPKSERDVLHIQEQFFAVAGFPKVVGVIDCTHVHLHGSKLKPIEHLYVNRKNRHSINVQLICGPDFLISNVVAR